MAKSELSNGNNNRNEKEVDVPTFQCVPNAQAVRLMSETLGFAQQTHPLTVEAGGYLVDVLSLHTGRDSLGCSVLPRLSMLDSYVCVGSVLCNGMNRDMCKSLSGRKGHFITYIDQNLQLHLMPPPQNVSPVDTIILSSIYSEVLSPRGYLSIS